MSRFSGKETPTRSQVRAQKKQEAEKRNAATPYERTRQYRRDIGLTR